MISPSQVAAMAGYALGTTGQKCTINRTVNTNGVWGVNAESFTLVAANVPCIRATPRGQGTRLQLAIMPGTVETQQEWLFLVSPVSLGGPDVHVNDQVIADGQTLRVQNVDETSYSPLNSFIASLLRP